MSQMLQVLRCPRSYDSLIGAEVNAELSHLPRDQRALLQGAAGSSPFLRSLIQSEQDWLEEALADPLAARQAVFQLCRACPPDQIKSVLRQAKRRLALLCALCDLAGHWPLEEVTGTLTRCGELAGDVAREGEIALLIKRKKLPGMSEDDIATAGGMSVFAMGKMGAYELNYSSDIDLICLFDETRFAPDDFMEARQAMVRATRNMSAALNDRTAEGYVFRTDLRLRPDPSVTPVALAMEAAERYYESLGRTWERAAYIKARACAGDIQAGERFLKTLTPFVWRRHLDFAAIEDAHNMRLRIRENKGTGGPITVLGHDMKLGRGGIREIEFFTQTRQLIAGGRDPSLRVRGTVEGLEALSAAGWISAEVAATLASHYRDHREVEHRIQMVHDAQTHRMPSSEEGVARIACLMDIDPELMVATLRERLGEVHRLTEDFFVPSTGGSKPAETLPEALDQSVIARWTTYPALRSDRGARIFERLKPELLARLSRAAHPSEALLALDGFLAGMPAGVQLFSLFEANPQLIDLLLDIVGTSPALANYLSRNSSVFDAVLDGGFFADWPGRDALITELQTALAAESDYERQLDLTRRWHREWHFRTGVHHLRGLIDAAAAGQQYADLADAVITGLLPVVCAQFAAKHGEMPGRGCVILGMGSLGAGQLTATSDLDLIMIYDPLDAEMSDGKRPLAVRPYYARLTQAMVTALTAPMAEGRLYEVDMRLRPSGNQGPVATSWPSFTHYQQNDAWVWEHLALTRARVITGEATLAQDVETFRAAVLAAPRETAAVLGQVAEMRARLAAAKTPEGPWDAKTGPGRMLDIELLGQAGTLLAGQSARGVIEGLHAGVASGVLDDASAQSLSAAYRLYWSVQSAARLIAGKGAEAAIQGEGGTAFLLRSSGYEQIAVLQQALETTYETVAAQIDAAVGPRNEADDDEPTT
ncbi:glutamine-synthetase adenylyltransferase [Phaeobacter sp. HF9A]|uniref:[protein-PII] uridylyltransferase family protein n=1 Tax=Phaeobacter sp. HF9A TaxID=2721561 RepID=UPI001431EA3C|nr:glutamine-synthetase adenylyltransferase [Phaeobacter sp. HF9A]NIZ14022.1 glutamine-synthetase adenylyltransferase [Phaeobacter sp. HF9A]